MTMSSTTTSKSSSSENESLKETPSIEARMTKTEMTTTTTTNTGVDDNGNSTSDNVNHDDDRNTCTAETTFPNNKNKDVHTLKIGDRVVLTNLQSASHLNGQHGTIVMRLNEKGRYAVDLDVKASRVTVKPTNIEMEEDLISSTKDHCNYRAGCQDGILEEIPHGRVVCKLLDVMRYITAHTYLGLHDQVHSIADIHRIRDTMGIQGLMMIQHFTATSWTYWTNNQTQEHDKNDDACPSTKQPQDIYTLLNTYYKEKLMPKIQEFKREPANQKKNEYKQDDIDIEIMEIEKGCQALQDSYGAAGWHTRLHGDFWIVGHDESKAGSGTYVVPSQNIHAVYKVLGIRNSLFPMVLKQGATRTTSGTATTPVLMKMTLIPWYGRLLYDGVVTPAPHGPARPPKQASSTLTQKLLKAVQLAQEENRLIDRFRELETPSARKAAAAVAAASIQKQPSNHNMQSSSVPSVPSLLPPMTTQERDLMEQLLALPAYPGSPTNFNQQAKMGCWIMRRMGYTEQDNPNHMGLIMVGNGMCAGPFTCSALKPTTVDILRAVLESSGTSGALRGNKRPWSISIDDYECYQRMKYLFETVSSHHNDASLEIDYYKPPSKEEESVFSM